MSDAKASHGSVRGTAEASPVVAREATLTLVALVASVAPIGLTLFGPGIELMRSNPGASPIELVRKTATMQPTMQQMMTMMSDIHRLTVPYVFAVLLPALVVLAVIAVYAHGRLPRLFNRITWGLGAGAIATLALEAVRGPGTALGAFPDDMPKVFGQMITGQTGAVAVLTGYPYHFLNGATFGLQFALLFGLVRWFWGMAWALVYELGMMLSPPVMMMAGAFGVRGY